MDQNKENKQGIKKEYTQRTFLGSEQRIYARNIPWNIHKKSLITNQDNQNTAEKGDEVRVKKSVFDGVA